MPSAQPAKKDPKDKGTTVITPVAIATYANVWKARPSLNPERGDQYSIVLVFPKGTDLSPLQKAAKLAVSKKWGDKPPSSLKNPFRKGDVDKPDDPTFKGAIFITARTNNKPGIVDSKVQPILDEMDFYSGCKCRASVYAMAYDQKGSKGVTFLLNNLQKVADGDRLAGRKKAEDEFDDTDDGDEEGDDNPFA